MATKKKAAKVLPKKKAIEQTTTRKRIKKSLGAIGTAADVQAWENGTGIECAPNE